MVKMIPIPIKVERTDSIIVPNQFSTNKFRYVEESKLTDGDAIDLLESESITYTISNRDNVKYYYTVKCSYYGVANGSGKGKTLAQAIMRALKILKLRKDRLDRFEF